MVTESKTLGADDAVESDRSRDLGYRGGNYCIEGVPVRRIADSCGTPFYAYSCANIEAAYHRYQSAFAGHDVQICYAVKANSNQAVIATLGSLGAGADVVSEGELRRALSAGIAASKIVYSGVAKTAVEMEFALGKDIRQFNVESEPELRTLSEVAVRLNKIAKIAFRINPDVDARTHAKISTGKSDSKFGVPWRSAIDIYAQAAALPGIEVCGIDMHIGSQVMELQPYEDAFGLLAGLVEQLREEGHSISSIDLGGGLGIRYDPDGEAPPTQDRYAQLAITTLEHLGCQLILEPGRSLVGGAGVLVGSVVYVKPGSQSTFLIIDAAMNDFLRPSMYSAYHHILSEQEGVVETESYDVVGPVCESSDTFARKRDMPVQASGDLVIIEGAGAYGSAMASTYNTRLMVPEVLVKGDEYRVVRKRTNYDDLIGRDALWDDADG